MSSNEPTCPITLLPMTNPVFCAKDGHIYEKEAILKWIRERGTSPFNPPMTITEADLGPVFGLTGAPAIATAADGSSGSVATVPSIHHQYIRPEDIEVKVMGVKNDHSEVIPNCLKICTEQRVPGRLPLTLVLVLDVSGSMALIDNFKDVENQVNRLDLVIHSVKLIIKMMGPEDQLGLVTFNSTAHVIFPLAKMTDDNVQRALTVVGNLKAGGGTSIWSGMESAMSMTSGGHILILTDGEDSSPDITVSKFTRSKHSDYTIHLFLYGVFMTKSLSLAEHIVTTGWLGFSSDLSLVGSLFVNFIATLLVTVSSNVITIGPTGTQHFGALLLGQPKIVTTISQETNKLILKELLEVDIGELQTFDRIEDLTFLHLPKIIELIQKRQIQDLITFVDTHQLLSFAPAVLEQSYDPAGTAQLVKAVASFDALHAWGEVYIAATLHALQRQYWPNFKDTFLHMFANKSDELANYRVMAEDIFLANPLVRHSTEIHNGSRTPAQAINSQMCYNSQGGCFAGESLVRMSDTSFRFIRELVPGDNVSVMDGSMTLRTAVVAAIVARKMPSDTLMIKMTRHCVVTPYHPMFRLRADKLTTQWGFPNDTDMPRTTLGEASDENVVYNILLKSSSLEKSFPVVFFGDMYFASLGHNITGPIIEHAYLGSNQVRKDILSYQKLLKDQSQPLWIEKEFRDPKTQEISGWFFEQPRRFLEKPSGNGENYVPFPPEDYMW